RYEGPLPRSAIQDDLLAEENRRRPIAPDMFEDPQVARPEFLPLVVIAVETRGPVPDDDSLAIGSGARPAIGVRSMRGVAFGIRNDSRPELFAAPAIEAVEPALLASLGGTGEEDLSSGHDRTAVSLVREGTFPADVVIGPPVQRDVFLARFTISV